MGVALWSIAFGAHGLGCGTPPSHGDINRRADAGDVARDVANEFADVPFESSWWPSLSVLDVRPGRGPFTGGTLAVVRGTAFADGATVTIGGRQATGVRRIDSHRIEVLTPAGSVGAADVTVTIGG